MQAVLDALDQQLGPRLGGGSVVLALSGGLDSVVLLHALAPWCQARDARLKAVHVHHGISANADSWAEHCQGLCAALGVPLAIEHLALNKGPRQSLEAIARDARYRVLADAMAPGDCLVTAHHLDDQAETFLLAARRGAGLDGLCAMPFARPFGPGTLIRPLLALSRKTLEAAAKGLAWVEDESNQDTAFDRNFLRQSLLPAAEVRLGGFSAGLARSAELLQQELPARDWLLTQELARRVGFDGSLDLGGAPVEAAALLLRAWAARVDEGVALGHKAVAEMLRQQHAAEDASVRVGDFGRFKGRWFYLPPTLGADKAALLTAIAWQPGGGLLQKGHWRFDLPGATRFHPHDRDQSRTLKKLWQEWGVPPWLRRHWPLLVGESGELLAVAGMAVAKGHFQPKGQFPAWDAPGAFQPFLRQPRPAPLA
ncbi:MAG: tRNA lysidine(34) synthetase TilS [Pseudomonadota bacterium]|uniref:tRNA lysidine(34) synthetase TilS n=1 Tax=Gallaecimonas pentaromativorans TaxID=584787 RepID=UPI00067F46B6|nr:tRNA lysidine(34) synthetase TilS [Gallaecimonas pentaromativorans]MED5524448.1 tRNA lysidine(34) synthetase TilS [Pseudomonadota bacterium]